MNTIDEIKTEMLFDLQVIIITLKELNLCLKSQEKS